MHSQNCPSLPQDTIYLHTGTENSRTHSPSPDDRRSLLAVSRNHSVIIRVTCPIGWNPTYWPCSLRWSFQPAQRLTFILSNSCIGLRFIITTVLFWFLLLPDRLS
ncbi:hypothetical protein BO86DRAFT_214841 [Aspergillus japonicus CBS 114.51]|uniref:Uncharacterized protein n=1 Tax=Aspergillus japonicus CBS 114.51 TaxID=1448312 RepID=A0A8T8WP81_ASPJA|nr:hypothetical protein BO86DRAFT_214841 [Aspergillus japonicus CBS 114.51]RAH77655.1 hypothetical protein BO86DRAFT_214841 [Aspergillus japonicus CBS 114.51]